MDIIKICYFCEKKKILTDFVKHKSSKDGYLNRCSECNNFVNRERRKDKDITLDEIKNKLDKNIITKKCKICKEEKELTNFSVHNSHKDGYSNKCKECSGNKIVLTKNKECNICKKNKILDEFVKHKKYEDGYMNKCKECHNKKISEKKKGKKKEKKIPKEGNKICKECDEEKIITDFVKHSSYSDGYGTRCKLCDNKIRLEKRNKKRENLKIDLTIKKICMTCEEEKIIADFGKTKNTNDGFLNRCKVCVNKIQLEKKKNREISDNLKNKVCKTCNIEKDIKEFSINRSYIDCYESDCKICFNEKKQEYLSIPEKREMFREACRQWEQKPENKEKRKKARQTEEFKIQMRVYQKKHRKTEKCKITRRKYKKMRYKTDYNYKILENLRSRIIKVIKGNNKSDTTKNLLGCSIKEFRNYIESLFKEGMTWDNHGTDGWHLDHIRPCSSFNFKNEVEQRICFNWRNMQPLWSEENLSKSDKWKIYEWKEDIKKLPLVT